MASVSGEVLLLLYADSYVPLMLNFSLSCFTSIFVFTGCDAFTATGKCSCLCRSSSPPRRILMPLCLAYLPLVKQPVLQFMVLTASVLTLCWTLLSLAVLVRTLSVKSSSLGRHTHHFQRTLEKIPLHAWKSCATPQVPRPHMIFVGRCRNPCRTMQQCSEPRCRSTHNVSC